MDALAGFRAVFAFVRTRSAWLAPGALAACGLLGACDGSGSERAPEAARAPAAAPGPDSAAESGELGGLEIVDPRDPALPWDFDLGIVPYGETVECTVKLKNADGRPLAIQEVQTACSCTTARLSYVDAQGTRIEAEKLGRPMLVLPPDLTAELVLVSDTRLVPVQNSAKRVRIVVITDSPTNPFLALEVHLIVELPFQALPGTLKLGDVAESEGARASAKIVSLGVDGRKLTGIERASPGVLATLTFDEGVVPEQWTLGVELAAPIERGPFERFVEVATSGPGGVGVGKPVRVPIVGVGVPDVELRPERLILVGLTVGTAGEVELFGHLSGQRLRVLSIRPDAQADGLILATAEPAAADDEGKSAHWRIRARLVADSPHELAGTLTIETDELGSLALPYAVAARR